ncbi:Lrp/AsnC family transcriptional regulator [Nocardiopsis composta]|uniref:DNA-binding Lrp family transcriptional regulator n=1 Tax=Nocardiopsis composta TaxID=157465 RepID=A0A7W8QLL4_9ACTN|nr:Lrp/AsnC family transcriptional regulator [Nocardiopsis composta]MBB5432015.1 DNA-binding Lrp family transcriptional regulator [Nocardiopsis composta]
MAVELDAVDRTIIALLRADGRMSVRTLAERAHVSRANAYSRLDRLRREGVIRGFTAVVDPDKCGYGLAAYVSVRIRQDSWEPFRDRLREISEVEHAALVSGDVDLILLVRVADAAALRTFVLERLQRIPEVVGTHTMFILDEPDMGRPDAAEP